MSTLSLEQDTRPALADVWKGLLVSVRQQPLQAGLFGLLIAGLVYFFFFFGAFDYGDGSTFGWASRAWNEGNDLQHGWLILPAAAYLAWLRRDRFAAAPKSCSWAGLPIALFGCALFVIGVRSLQARIALVALPVIIYGSVRFLWGRETARHAFFPCAFLLFTVPVGFLFSRTTPLQVFTANFTAALSRLFGIDVLADGTKLLAGNGSFNFEVAGGCSGIRSLSAMTVLAAVYVHFTQDRFWRKLVLFAGSLVFALLGNLIRVFSVVLFARFISPSIAGGLYHDYSGFVFFPVAVAAMLGAASLLNRDWSHWWKPEPIAPLPVRSEGAPASKAASPVSYDY